MAQEPSLPDKVVAIDEALEGARIPHAFGGALSLAYYAEPRATVDIDINLFVTVDRHPEVAAILSKLGVAVDLDANVLREAGQARIWWGRSPVDLFYAYDELHDAMRRAVRRVPFGETEIPILSPEHLIVCKVAFDRPKDWIDIEQMLAVTDDLDTGEVDRWLRRVLPGGDARLGRVEKLVSRLRSN